MFDWLGRVLLLVLAGLATFAVIGSLMAASVIRSDSTPRGPSTSMVEQRNSPANEPVSETSDTDTNGPGAGVSGVEVVAAPVQPDPVTRWLEALTYAVLALAGFAAAGLLVLLRITYHLSAIARAAQARS